METNIGCRIFSEVNRPSDEIVEMFKDLPSSNINDEMNRLYCMHDYIRLLNPQTSRQLLGTAFTVKVPLGDNLMFHQALDMAQPGDVLVVDGGSGNNRSLCGELMMTFAQGKGLAGVVVDGCVRDWDGLETLTMPIYAKGITPQGPWKNGPGEINVPVSCGGQVIFPGDILVGDRDGIVVIRPQDAEYIAKKAIKKKAGEDASFALMREDFVAYTGKHEKSTQSRIANSGQKIDVIDSYQKIYT